MTLIAVVLALLLERALWHALHLRESGWVAGYYGWLKGRIAGSRRTIQVIGCIAGLLLLALPVAIAAVALDRWLPPVSWVIFAALVLVFSLGPRDLDQELEDYITAETAGDAARAQAAATIIIEHDAAQRRESRAESVEEAAFVQANNRLFGVLFWFVLLTPLGPVGAVLFRAASILSRRWDASRGRFGLCAQRVFHIINWVPARLTALTYAIAGNFEDATYAWRTQADTWPEPEEGVVIAAGAGAMGVKLGQNVTVGGESVWRPELGTGQAPDADCIDSAVSMIWRGLVIWLAAGLLIVIAGWVS